MSKRKSTPLARIRRAWKEIRAKEAALAFDERALRKEKLEFENRKELIEQHLQAKRREVDAPTPAGVRAANLHVTPPEAVS